MLFLADYGTAATGGAFVVISCGIQYEGIGLVLKLGTIGDEFVCTVIGAWFLGFTVYETYTEGTLLFIN